MARPKGAPDFAPRSRGGGTRTPGLRFWRPPLYQLSYAPRLEDCSRDPFRIRLRVKQRPALGALFSLLAIGFAGVAFAAGHGAGREVGRWVVAFAAGALAVWLATLAWRALR